MCLLKMSQNAVFSTSINVSADNKLHSFIVQYIALMIIVLAFVIGAFSKTPQAETAKPQQLDAISAHPKPLLPAWRREIKRDQIVISDLFLDGSEEINPDQGNAVVSLLSSHDLYMVIETSWGECSDNQNGCIEKANSRALELERFLNAHSINSSTYKIFAVSGENSETRIELYEFRGEQSK